MSYLTTLDGLVTQDVEKLVITMLNASTALHVLHINTRTLSSHLGLGEIYEALASHADDLAEGYQGATLASLKFREAPIKIPKTVEEAITLLKELKDNISSAQKGLKDYSELVNQLDEAKSDINKALYKLKFLA